MITTQQQICFMGYHDDSRFVFHYFLQYTGKITHKVLAEVVRRSLFVKSYAFICQPCSGYVGWDKDVILIWTRFKETSKCAAEHDVRLCSNLWETQLLHLSVSNCGDFCSERLPTDSQLKSSFLQVINHIPVKISMCFLCTPEQSRSHLGHLGAHRQV